MAPFRLEISSHAKERLKQRQITRQQIRACLLLGQLSGTDIKGRRVKESKHGNRILVVIYIEVLGGFLIITSYWKGRL